MEEKIEAQLAAIAEKRMAQFDPKEGVPAEEVYRALGISDDVMADYRDVEIE